MIFCEGGIECIVEYKLDVEMVVVIVVIDCEINMVSGICLCCFFLIF